MTSPEETIREALQDGAKPGDARYVYPDAWAALEALAVLGRQRDEALVHADANHDEYLEEFEESARLRERAETAERQLAEKDEALREIATYTSPKNVEHDAFGQFAVVRMQEIARRGLLAKGARRE